MTTPRSRGLEPDEDGELRRLAALSEYGIPGGGIGARMTELRQRDRRASVRAPRQQDTAVTKDPGRG